MKTFQKLLITNALLFALFLGWGIGEAQRVNGVSTPTFGATTVSTLDTGFGANELYDMDQHVLTTSSPRFTSLNVGVSGTGAVVTAGNGTITLTGDGDGTDESWTWGMNTSNLLTLSSASGGTTVFFSGVNISVPIYFNQVGTVTVDGATTFAVSNQYITLACTGAETINTITGGAQGMILTTPTARSRTTTRRPHPTPSISPGRPRTMSERSTR
jgi:hypothetical protein